MKKRTIIGATASPMNARQWLATLSCSHEMWVTRTKRPVIGVATVPLCQTCEAAQVSSDPEGGST